MVAGLRWNPGEDENGGRDTVRTVITAMFTAAGIGLLAAPSGSASPVNGAAFDRTATAASLFSPARYDVRHGRRCYAKCYYDFFVGHRVCRRFC